MIQKSAHPSFRWPYLFQLVALTTASGIYVYASVRFSFVSSAVVTAAPAILGAVALIIAPYSAATRTILWLQISVVSLVTYGAFSTRQGADVVAIALLVGFISLYVFGIASFFTALSALKNRRDNEVDP